MVSKNNHLLVSLPFVPFYSYITLVPLLSPLFISVLLNQDVLAVLPDELLADLNSAVHFPLMNSVSCAFLVLLLLSKCFFTQHRQSAFSSMLECLGGEHLSPPPHLHVLAYLTVVG